MSESARDSATNQDQAESELVEPTAQGPAQAQAEAEPDAATLSRELGEAKEQVLRVRAEFANYQKRAKQQADEYRLYAVGSLARDLLDPLDNLDRAIEAARGSNSESIVSGLEMVRRQLHEVLAKHGVEPIAAQGEPFDPNHHEAIMQQPTAEHPEGTVVSEFSKGYRIKDRVLRPSKVAVAVKQS